MEERGDRFGVALGRSFYKKSQGIKWAEKKGPFLHLELQFKSSGLQPIFQWVICPQDLQLYIQGQYH